MFEEDLPESESSDEDFVPTGAGGTDVSEEDSDDAIEDFQDNDNINSSTGKRKKNSSKTSRKKKKEDSDEDVEPKVEVKPNENPEEKKKRADNLWADFLKDCSPATKKKETPQNSVSSRINNSTPIQKSITEIESSSIESENDHLSSSSNSMKVNNNQNHNGGSEGQSGSNKITEIYEFAGEKVVVEKKVDLAKKISRGGGGGVAAILSQINKKGKLSTLEKSKLDWEGFKEKEGIGEQLSSYNRGKKGYLEKQDFLERADLKQFELEKQMRDYSRSKRL